MLNKIIQTASHCSNALQGDRYRVQFAKQELLTALVEDVWVIPMNPADNLPDPGELRERKRKMNERRETEKGCIP